MKQKIWRLVTGWFIRRGADKELEANLKYTVKPIDDDKERIAYLAGFRDGCNAIGEHCTLYFNLNGDDAASICGALIGAIVGRHGLEPSDYHRVKTYRRREDPKMFQGPHVPSEVEAPVRHVEGVQ